MSAVSRVSAPASSFPQLPREAAHEKNVLQKVIEAIGIRHPLCGVVALADLCISKSFQQSAVIFVISEISYSFLQSHGSNKQKKMGKVGDEEKAMVETLLYTTLNRSYNRCFPDHTPPSEVPALLEKLNDPCGELRKKTEQARSNHQPGTAARRKERLSSWKVDATLFDLYQKIREGNTEKALEISKLLKEKEFKDRDVDKDGETRIRSFTEFLQQMVQKNPNAVAIKTSLRKVFLKKVKNLKPLDNQSRIYSFERKMPIP